MTKQAKASCFLIFKEVPTKGKTKMFLVHSAHSNDFLGRIIWRNGWRRYVMSFEADCDWSIECMAECYKFVAKLMQDRKRPDGPSIPPSDLSDGIIEVIV